MSPVFPDHVTRAYGIIPTQDTIAVQVTNTNITSMLIDLKRRNNKRKFVFTREPPLRRPAQLFFSPVPLAAGTELPVVPLPTVAAYSGVLPDFPSTIL